MLSGFPVASRLRLLVICSWDHRSSALHESLRAAGIDAALVRVDTEPSLHAALKRGPFRAAVFVRDTAGLTDDLVRTQLLVQAPETPLVVVDDVTAVGFALAAIVHRN